MFVDPATPLPKVVGAALVGNRAERSDLHLVVHRHVDVPNFARVRILVPQSDVAPAPRDGYVPETSQDGDDLTAGERRPNYRLLQEVWKVSVLVARLDAEFVPQEGVRIVDPLAVAFVECENFGELCERLGTGVAAAGQPRFEVLGGDTPVVLTVEDDSLRLVVVSRRARHYNEVGLTSMISLRPSPRRPVDVPTQRVHCSSLTSFASVNGLAGASPK